MTRTVRGARRGSALILVLIMTLAVAGLSIAAIFLSSSAGLLSRFYDREREFRLAAESGIEIVRSRLVRDPALALPDTGVVQLAAGLQIPTATGGVTRARVNVWGAVTGDTTPTALPTITLIAAAYEPGGTRHVRRVDLRRESFARYALFADSVPAGTAFGPGVVHGRVHTNGTWRVGAGASAAVHRDTVTAVDGFAGDGTYADSVRGAARVHYPRDSTYPRLAALADSAALAFTPVSAFGAGWQSGSRLEFVGVDADANGRFDVSEGFVRVFDLEPGMDTSRLSVGLEPTQFFLFIPPYYAKRWDDPVVQNQCGAFYRRGSRWHFFPVATHRAAWARNVIQATGASNFPMVTPPTMNTMDDYTYSAVATILSLPTSRCFPAGSPYLMTTERKTDPSGVTTGTAADSVPFGVVTPPGGWPTSAPNGYGGADTTFTARARTCTISTSGTSGRCANGTLVTLGAWRVFGGAAVTGIPSGVRQGAELPFLWPVDPSRNAGSRRVLHATAGPLLVSGTPVGDATLLVSGAVRIIDQLASPVASAGTCAGHLGVLAVGDILVADNAITRGKRIGNLLTYPLSRHLGGDHHLALDATLMSLQGTVGVEAPTVTGLDSQSCPHDASASYSGGCLQVRGGLIMRVLTPLAGGSGSGFRYEGAPDACQSPLRRPPHFPLTNRHVLARELEIEPVRANTPAKIRSLLLRLKGRRL